MAWTWIETRRGARCRVLQLGDSGDDVVYLHGMGGLDEGDPLLARLAERYRVHAPELPGYGESTGEELLEDMLDFTLHGWDAIDATFGDGSRPHIVAHSMGGMIAAEMACVDPARPRKLALVAPAGLWIDEHPVPDVFGMLPHHLPGVLFADAEKGAASMTRGSNFTDQQALLDFFIGNAKRLGTAGKILFPIPNRRLSKRLYRLRAETLLVWGEADALMPVGPYASRWQELVPHASLVTIPDAGHMATVEQPDATAAAIEKFFG